MEFLSSKFYDGENLSYQFYKPGNILLDLETSEQIDSGVKLEFVRCFIESIIDLGIISRESINSVPNENPWSIDFPSWWGRLDENRGKKFFIIGSEPHIHFKYLQTVYGLNGTRSVDFFIDKGHSIFRFITEILSQRFSISTNEVLSECYITDLFPMSPLRSKATKVGSSTKIQAIIGNYDSWEKVRSRYATKHLENEIRAVNPEILITQGKTVLNEVVDILNIKEKVIEIPILPRKGKRQFIRKTYWNGIPVFSVPHIGSNRLRTFWNQNLEMIKYEFGRN